MRKVTNEKYLKELEELEIRMIGAELFAEKFPYFKDQILDEKLTDSDHYIKFNSKYKDLYLSWGINRRYHKTARDLTNYYDKQAIIESHLTDIYVNTLTLYDMHDNFGLYDITDKCDVYYIDHVNSTFYLKDDQLIDFLDNLNEWYLKAKSEAKKVKLAKKKARLEAELAKLG